MKRRLLALPLALVLVAAAPAAAPVAAPVPAGFDAGLAQAAALVDGNHPADALVLLDPMLAAAELPAERGQIEALRSFALARLERLPDARAAIEAGVANLDAPSMLLLRQLFILRALSGDTNAAADTLQLIAASDPKALNPLPSELVSDVLRAIRTDDARAFELEYALVAADWQPADATLAELDWLRLRLITGLAKRGRIDDARAILAAVLNPVVLVRIGIDRRFAALWPAVEARLGPGADIADAAYVARAKAIFDTAPKSLVARMGYAEALNVASREPEAAVIADVAKTPAELAALNNREVWIVNLHAALLGDAGKIDAALARYAALNASPPAGRTALIGTIINQALFAESVDRPKDALAAADVADSPAVATNQFGKLFIAQARACAMQQLGKPQEALGFAAPLISKPDGNDDAYLAAMICLGRTDAAAAAIVRRLGEPDNRAEMLFTLQPFLIADRPVVRDARQRAGLRALKARPDVKAAFLKAGRDLPARVAPPR